MTTFHHMDGPICSSCEEKLYEAHPYLRDWFHRVKKKYLNVHVSCSFRGEEDQEKAVLEHKSKLHFPNSAHNRLDDNSQPCSRALDIFQIDEDGVARFSYPFYKKLAQECEQDQDQDQIKWGGNWKTLGDSDHFQYEPRIS